MVGLSSRKPARVAARKVCLFRSGFERMKSLSFKNYRFESPNLSVLIEYRLRARKFGEGCAKCTEK